MRRNHCRNRPLVLPGSCTPRSPAWATLDLAVNYRLNRGTTLFAGINNLTNRQRDFTQANDYGPIAGRFIYLGAKFAFGNAI